LEQKYLGLARVRTNPKLAAPNPGCYRPPSLGFETPKNFAPVILIFGRKKFDHFMVNLSNPRDASYLLQRYPAIYS
jgi:hypothetical protein